MGVPHPPSPSTSHWARDHGVEYHTSGSPPSALAVSTTVQTRFEEHSSLDSPRDLKSFSDKWHIATCFEKSGTFCSRIPPLWAKVPGDHGRQQIASPADLSHSLTVINGAVVVLLFFKVFSWLFSEFSALL
jgi:hypothetical protein